MKSRVLVVDDDYVARRLITAVLAKHDFLVQSAASVDEAEAILRDDGPQAFGAVVTDYRMPLRNGLDMLASVRRADPSLASIMVTAEGEKSLVADSMRGGALDFLEKPIAAPGLIAAVDRAVKTTLRQRELAGANAAVKQVAAVQQALLTLHSRSVGDAVKVLFYPKQQAGGDFAAVIPLTGKKFLVLATDVSGHDLRAAFIAAYFQGVVRGMAENSVPMESVFEFFNTFLCRDWNVSGNGGYSSAVTTSVSACAITVDPEREQIAVLDCGFPRPLLTEGNGRARWLSEESSTPLGWFPVVGLVSETSTVRDGGTITLWSDGLEDLADNLGVDVLSALHGLKEARRQDRMPKEILASQRDDIIAIEISLSREKAGGTVLVFQTYPGDSAPRIDAAQELWTKSLKLALPSLSEASVFDVMLCAREALLNALVHGCAGEAEKQATFQITYFAETERLVLRVDDPGDGYTAQRTDAINGAGELRDGHRGLTLMEHLSSRLIFERGGATVILEFQTASPIPSQA